LGRRVFLRFFWFFYFFFFTIFPFSFDLPFPPSVLFLPENLKLFSGLSPFYKNGQEKGSQSLASVAL